MQGRRCKPTKGLFSRLGGLALLERFSLSLSLSLFSRAYIRVPLLLVPFIFLAPCLGRIPWVWKYLFYIFCTLLGHNLRTLAMFVFFSCCVITLCMMYVYLYMLVYGWSYTFYDGISWLHEQPSLDMSALDLVLWVCAQDICCRCTLTLYCVHNHRGVIVSIHVTKWHWFPCVCDTY